MTINTLVLSSGGTKGLCFIGALEFLVKYDNLEINKINKFCGTSIGALVSLLLYIINDLDKVKKMFLETNVNELLCDIKIINFINTMGVASTDKIKDRIKSVLINNGLSENITLQQLKNIYKKDIVFVSTDIISEKIVYITPETFPDMLIIDAVLSSMAIPFVFPPIKYKNFCFVDGALLESVCINKEIIGEDNYLILDLTSSSIKDIKEINSFKDYITKLLKTSIDNNKKILKFNHFIIESSDVNIIDTKLDKQRMLFLINEGYEFMKKQAKVKKE